MSHWYFGLVVYDVTVPQTPAYLGRYARQAEAPTGAAVAGLFGDRTLVFESSDGWGGHIRVLDVTDPAAITAVSEVRRRNEVSVAGLQLTGNKLYVAAYQDGVRIYDVSTPSLPQQTAYFNTWDEARPGTGGSFRDGVFAVRPGGDGLVYAVDKPRGLLILQEAPPLP